MPGSFVLAASAPVSAQMRDSLPVTLTASRPTMRVAKNSASGARGCQRPSFWTGMAGGLEISSKLLTNV